MYNTQERTKMDPKSRTCIFLEYADGSTTGYVFTLAVAVSRVSKLQTVVALSTTEAEYMAATQACKETIWIQITKIIRGAWTQTRENFCVL